ncbi:MAG TPA: hypothetical protein VLC93_03480, partial [Myxococcota bacterium]|nr:hypothetical protein [Myxococcota bacterium]
MTILAATEISGPRSVLPVPPGEALPARTAVDAASDRDSRVRAIDPKILGATPGSGTHPRLGLAPASRISAPTTAIDEQRDFAAQSRMVYMREQGGQKHIFLTRGDGTEPVQLTQGNAWHLYPDISPDGRWVTYAQGSGQNDLSIVLRDLETGATRTLSTTAGMNLHPRFAKDGRSLAYSGPLGPDGRHQIGIVRLDALRDGQAPETRVIASDKPCYFPSLSSDGSTVVFQRDVSPTQRELVMRDLASGEERVIQTPGPISMAPTWSADGGWVAYTCKVDGDWEIYVTDVRTNETARITRQAAADFAPHFRADNTLLFASNLGGNFRIYQTHVGSLGQGQFPIRPLVVGEGDDYAPRTSGLVNIEQRQLAGISEPARSSFGAARVGDRVYIAGGHQGHEHTYPPESFMARLEYYDLAT